MKRSIIIVLTMVACISSNVQSQNSISNFLPTRSSKVLYTEVIEEKGNSKENFGVKGIQWMDSQHLKDTRLSYPDERKVRLTGQWTTNLLWGPNDFKELYKNISCEIEIIAKKERYQYKFNEFKVHEKGSVIQLEIYKNDEKKSSKYNEAFYKKIDDEVKKLIEDLVQKMRAPIKEKPTEK